MNWLGRILNRSDEIDREIDEELRFHIETKIERYITGGMTPEQARHKAMERFGNFQNVREAVREIDLGIIESVWQDVRYSARTLVRSPGFSAVAIASLAVGIGLNSAIFSAVNAVLLRPLPYPEPDRLMAIGETSPRYPTRPVISPANYLDWEKQNTAFESMAVVDIFNFGNYGRVTLTGLNQPAQIQALHVSASFFRVLGVQPALGRDFTPDDDRVGARFVVLSHRLWQRLFDGDPGVLGRAIGLDDEHYKVIAVMPKGFRYRQYNLDAEIDLWLPGVFEYTPVSNRSGGQLRAIARLKSGISLGQARAEAAVISQRLATAFPKENKNEKLRAVPLFETVAGEQRSSLLLFLGAVGFVLLIACANVANLLLARAGARHREIAIRISIGAGRPRLVRQLLTESLLLALTGGTAGLILTFWSARLLNRILPDTIFRLDEANVDLRVLVFTVCVSIVSAVLFGLAPALQASKAELKNAPREAGRSVSERSAGARLRGSLIVLQMAMSVVLLAGAGLMINSLWRLHEIRLGFDPHELLTLQCILPKSPKYVTSQGLQVLAPGGSVKVPGWVLNRQAIQFVEQVTDSLSKLPGVESAAGSVCGLPMGRVLGDRFQIEGRPGPPDGEAANRFGVSPGYFRALKIGLLQGREFDSRDDLGAPRVAIINSAMARKFWPGEGNVIGRRIRWGLPLQAYQIVGIVDDIRLRPGQKFEPQMYFPQAQMWQPRYTGILMNLRLEIYFVVRARTNPEALAEAAQDVIRKIDPTLPVNEIHMMDEVVSKAFGPWRATMLLIGIFAAVAVLLVAVGIYGVIVYTVTRRTHEIGVRMALGASRADVVRLLMRNGIQLSLAGISLGLGGSYWLTRLLASQLYGVTPTDPQTLTTVALALLVVALISCYLPARRAARLDPSDALRCD